MAAGELAVLQVLACQVGAHLVARLDIEDILQGATLRCLGAFGQLVYLELVYQAAVGEEEHRAVHRGGVYVLDEVLLAGVAASRAHAATVLGAVLAQGCALDVAHVRDGDNHVVVRVEVLGIEVAGGVVDVGLASIAIGVADFLQFLADDATTLVLVAEDELQLSDVFLDFLVFVFEFGLLQLSELAQTHIDDCLSLNLREVEALGEALACLVGRCRGADDGDYLVDIL